MENVAKNQKITVEQAKAARVATVPAKRFGYPDEFGAACAFLCSAHAGYITGPNLLIDGGVFPGAFCCHSGLLASLGPGMTAEKKEPGASTGLKSGGWERGAV
jgi:hypothetical protein